MTIVFGFCIYILLRKSKRNNATIYFIDERSRLQVIENSRNATSKEEISINSESFGFISFLQLISYIPLLNVTTVIEYKFATLTIATPF